MSTTRKLIIAFWIFIGCMLLWQFYTYDQGLTRAEVEHPTQQHFWFTNSAAAAPAAPTKALANGAVVQQTGFSVENNAPSAGSFTCHVTLKNVGNAKAVGVQVSVRPYRGITLDDQDVGHARPAAVTLSDSDPISQYGQWVSFPDLAPGESGTQNAVFLSRTDVIPGTNPNPEIQFQTEKAKP
jgi:hypothetical protein